MDRIRRLAAIIFDLDDTLYPERDYVMSGFRFLSLTIESRYGLPAEVAFAELAQDFDQGHRGKNINLLLDRHGIDYKEDDIADLVSAYREHDPDIELPEDTRSVLDKLRSEGMRMGLLTDGFFNAQSKKIDKLGLKEYFKSIIYTDELGKEFWKPHVEPFAKICRELEVAPELCAYVGDNPLKDFFGAKKLGMLTIHAKRWAALGHDGVDKDYQADCAVNNLDELIFLLGLA